MACILNLLRSGRDAYFPEDRIPASEIHYRIYGEGNSETIVLVHGLSGNLSTWDEIAPILAEKFKVIVYDQRGHGLTPARGHNFSSTMLAYDLKALLDSLGIRRVHLLGHSMGGRTVMKFGALFPESTRSVMVEDMHFIGRTKPLADDTLLSANLSALKDGRFDTVDDAIAAAEDRLGPVTVRDLDHFGLLRGGDGRFYFSRINPNVPLYSAQGLQEDLTSSLASAPSPVLLMTADPEKDAVLFGKGLDHARLIRPDATIVPFPGASHGIHGDQPRRFVAVVRNFIKQVKP